MQNLYTEKFNINDTNLDFSMQMPVYEIIKLLQGATFVHSNSIGLDHKTMQEKRTLFGLLLK